MCDTCDYCNQPVIVESDGSWDCYNENCPCELVKCDDCGGYLDHNGDEFELCQCQQLGRVA